MATIKDVAKLAGVSIATVSRVYNESDYVSSITKEKVYSAACALDYTPNFTARSLKSNKSKVIGIIISNFENSFYNMITRQIEEMLKKRGYRLLVTFSNEEASTEKDCIQVLVSSRVDGLIYTPAYIDNMYIKKLSCAYDIAILQAYRNAVPDIDSLVIDDAYGTYLAIKKLIENGHSRILLIDYDVPIPTRRSEGYIEAFEEAGIPYDEKYIIKIKFSADYKAVIDKCITELAPTALLVSGNQLGMEVMDYCTEKGISVPNDLSLVVYDDSDCAKILNITVVAHYYTEIAASLTNIILNRINNKEESVTKEILKPYLIERKSILNLNK